MYMLVTRIYATAIIMVSRVLLFTSAQKVIVPWDRGLNFHFKVILYSFKKFYCTNDNLLKIGAGLKVKSIKIKKQKYLTIGLVSNV